MFAGLPLNKIAHMTHLLRCLSQLISISETFQKLPMTWSVSLSRLPLNSARQYMGESICTMNNIRHSY